MKQKEEKSSDFTQNNPLWDLLVLLEDAIYYAESMSPEIMISAKELHVAIQEALLAKGRKVSQ